MPRVLTEEFKDNTLEGSQFIMIDFEEFIYHYGNEFSMPDTSIQQITSKLKYQKSLIDYLESNKKALLEDTIIDKHENYDYNNQFCRKLSALSFFGAHVDSIDDFIIDKVNIIQSNFKNDDNDDLKYIESKIEIECTADIREYIARDVSHIGRIEVKFKMDMKMCYLLNISNVYIKY